MAGFAEATPVSPYAHLLYKRDTEGEGTGEDEATEEETTEKSEGIGEKIKGGFKKAEDKFVEMEHTIADKTGMKPW